MTGPVWSREAVADYRRFLNAVALVVAGIGALALASAGVVLLVTGRFVGWVVVVAAVAVWLTAHGLWRAEHPEDDQ